MILTPDGEILTNDHVIANATQIRVTLHGQKTTYPATLLGTDPSYDVALLQVHGPTTLRAVSFGDSSTIQVGEDVLAIGNALALSQSTPSVTEGIISAEGRSIKAGGDNCAGTESLSGLLQTQAPINPGNSGGPLVNSAGQVIGMNTAAATRTSGDAPTQNIGFAIPIANIRSLIPGLRKGGTDRDAQGLLGCRSGLGHAGGALQLGSHREKRRAGGERVPRRPGRSGGNRHWRRHSHVRRSHHHYRCLAHRGRASSPSRRKSDGRVLPGPDACDDFARAGQQAGAGGRLELSTSCHGADLSDREQGSPKSSRRGRSAGAQLHSLKAFRS